MLVSEKRKVEGCKGGFSWVSFLVLCWASKQSLPRSERKIKNLAIFVKICSVEFKQGVFIPFNLSAIYRALRNAVLIYLKRWISFSGCCVASFSLEGMDWRPVAAAALYPFFLLLVHRFPRSLSWMYYVEPLNWREKGKIFVTWKVRSLSPSFIFTVSFCSNLTLALLVHCLCSGTTIDRCLEVGTGCCQTVFRW